MHREVKVSAKSALRTITKRKEPPNLLLLYEVATPNSENARNAKCLSADFARSKNAGAETNNAPGSNPAMTAPHNPAHARKEQGKRERNAVDAKNAHCIRMIHHAMGD